MPVPDWRLAAALWDMGLGSPLYLQGSLSGTFAAASAFADESFASTHDGLGIAAGTAHFTTKRVGYYAIVASVTSATASTNVGIQILIGGSVVASRNNSAGTTSTSWLTPAPVAAGTVIQVQAAANVQEASSGSLLLVFVPVADHLR